MLGVAALAFSGPGVFILPLLGGDFMPDFNRGEYQIAFKASPGTTLRETGERTREMIRRLKTLPDVEYTYTTIGESGSSFRPVNEGTTYVKLQARLRARRFSEVLREARRKIEERARLHLRPLRGRPLRAEAHPDQRARRPTWTSWTASPAS